MENSRDRDVVELLGRLAAIDSQNSSLVPGAAGEAEIVAFIERWAAAAGLDVVRLEETCGRPSLLVASGPEGDGPSLMLCAHTDTVGTGGMTEALAPVIDGDRMAGRGVYDMKAGLAAALVAAREYARSPGRGRVVVAAVADEEHSSIGIQEVLRRYRPDAAVVAEPTELAVAVAHRGFTWIEIEVTGVAAHGSRPHLGRDAILKTGPILVALEGLNARLASRQHPRLGRGFLHGSLISGGREESTFPDRCTVTVERRTIPGETVADVEREIAEVLDACRAADPELVVDARVTLARSPFEITEDAPFVGIVVGAVSRTLGRQAELGGVSYWADSSFIADAGVPTVLFGPAGEGAHADVEWVSLSSTIACTRALLAIAHDVCDYAGELGPGEGDRDR